MAFRENGEMMYDLRNDEVTKEGGRGREAIDASGGCVGETICRTAAAGGRCH